MTCVVGLVHNKKVYIGGDSAGSAGIDVVIRSHPKVFKNNEFLMGYAGSFRMGQMLQYKFKPPVLTKSKTKDIYKFMTNDFIDKLRLCMHKDFKALQEEVDNSAGCFMIGIQDRLFTLFNLEDVAEHNDGYHAIGCSDAYALGSLYSTKTINDPSKRLTLALEASTHYSAGVRGPYHIISNE